MTTQEHNDLLRPTEAADYAGVTPKTLTRWARAGWLPALRTAGGHFRYRRGDLDRALRARDAVGKR